MIVVNIHLQIRLTDEQARRVTRATGYRTQARDIARRVKRLIRADLEITDVPGNGPRIRPGMGVVSLEAHRAVEVTLPIED